MDDVRSNPSQSTPAVEHRFNDALRAWEHIVGQEHVQVANRVLDSYARSTSPLTNCPIAILYPKSTTEVQRIIDVSGKFFLPLHPISRGKNWGYGDAAPPGPGQVLLDLKRMNRIVDLNVELGYAVVQPGVTQGQLYDYLREHDTGLWPDSTGAGRGASLIGNALDRGFGHTRYGDHSHTACGMEIVLADGRILNTGFGHYDNAKSRYVYRAGIGPSLDGLFAQSNLGIVTQIGLWLMPEPEAFTSFFLSTPNDDDLGDLIDRLARLRRQGLLQSCIHVANDYRVMAARTRYPWDRAQGRTPLPHELRLEMRRELGAGAWNTIGAIYGTPETVAATAKVLRRALAGYRLVFVDDQKLARAERLASTLSWTGFGQRLKATIELIKPTYGLLKGIPTDEPLRGAGWRVRDPDPEEPMDPLDVHAGLIWISPIVPATGEHARELMRIIEPIYLEHAFEPMVTLTLITERALCCVTNVSFDRRDEEESARALACYRRLNAALAAAGYYPYRTGPYGFDKLSEGSSVYWDVVDQIRHALDPHNLISPGRYEPQKPPSHNPGT